MDNASSEKTFDVALRELESIVSSLEQGDTQLEELLDKYERGMKLHQHCQKMLHAAELRIEQLRKNNEGKPEFIPVETPDSAAF